MKCQKCQREFDIMMASCGTGMTWSLLKCSHCNQLHVSGSIIPKEVLKDNKIIITENKAVGVHALTAVTTDNAIWDGIDRLEDTCQN